MLSINCSSLIFMAIEGSNEKALPVKEIYAWIVQHFPYFKTAPNGWKNSVRHNLSLNKSFVKVEKAPNMGKGSLWRVEPQQRQNLIQALNRSPFFPNSAVDKISPSLKSPSGGSAYDSLDGGGSGSVSSAQPVAGGAGVPAAAAVALSTPTKSNGLALANGASQATNAARPHSPNGGGSGSHARFDPYLFPNLSKLFAIYAKIRSGSQCCKMPSMTSCPAIITIIITIIVAASTITWVRMGQVELAAVVLGQRKWSFRRHQFRATGPRLRSGQH